MCIHWNDFHHGCLHHLFFELDATEEQIEFALKYYATSFSMANGGTELRCLFPNGSLLKVWIVGGIPLGQSVIIKSTAWMENLND